MRHQSARKIVDALDREIRRRKRGIVAQVGRLVRRSRSWWGQRRATGDLSIGQLMVILDYLKVSPARFLRQALGEGQAEFDFKPPKGEPPEVVQRALERFSHPDQAGMLDLAFLETLDTIRYEQPHEALRQAEWGVHRLTPSLVPRFLGVVASIFRHLSRLSEAEHALLRGLDLANGQGDLAVSARLLQRLAFILADNGELETALATSERAGARFLRNEDWDEVARCIYDQALFLSYLGEMQQSTSVARVALRWLPRKDEHYRCAAYHLIAMNLHAEGNLNSSLKYLMRADRLAKTNESLARDKIQWLMGKIQADLGQLDEAEQLLLNVYGRFCEYRNGEDALLICDLVSVQLRQEKWAEAYQTASAMLKLLEPLRHDKVISAAIADLLRQGQEGLTLALVDQVKARIRGELRATISAQRKS